MATFSIETRLAVAASAVLLIALLLAGFGLVLIFDRAIERQAIDELERQVKALSGHVIADNSGGISLDQAPSDPRFQTPYDGLYWQIEGPNQSLLRSRSLWDTRLAVPGAINGAGEPLATSLAGPNDSVLLAAIRTLDIKGQDKLARVKIIVALDRLQLSATRGEFLQLLVPALLLLGLVLLVALITFIKIGLSPLRLLRTQIVALRQGRTRVLAGAYPGEVQPLVDELNRFIATQDGMLLAARQQAGDLVHGLKTPIAVLQAAARSLGDRQETAMAEIVTSQTSLLDRQVRRALARTRAGVTAAMSRHSLLLAPLLERLVNAMRVLGSARRVQWQLQLDQSAMAPGDDVDMLELFGNILDNARQWAKSSVNVSLSCNDGFLIVIIADDGPGMPDDQLEIPQRGMRLDQSQGGSGFGLAISRDIANAYRGALTLAHAHTGGLEVTIRLPQPAEINSTQYAARS